MMPVPTQAVEILRLESEALTDSGTPPESDPGANRGLQEAGDRGTAQLTKTALWE